jgi:hypothetical protein
LRNDAAPPDGATGLRLGVRLLPVAAALVAYLLTPATAVLGGDHGEFVTLFAGPGVAHPSGYPLYTLLLRAASWIIPASAVTGSSIATALIAALGLCFFAGALARWGVGALAAAVATALLGFSPLYWIMATHAEVFAAHAALAAAILLVAVPMSTQPTIRAGVLGLLAGLGLCNNLTLVALAPLGLTATALAIAGASQRPRAIAAAAAGLALGLLPILALPWLASGPAVVWAWGDVTTPSGLWRHLLRADFGTTQLGIYEGGEGLWLRQILTFGAAALRELRWVGPPLALLGLAGLLARHHETPRRLLAAAVLASLLLGGPVLLALFNLAPDGVAAAVVERFYLLPLVLIAFLAAFGLDAVLTHVRPLGAFEGAAVTVACCVFAAPSIAPVRTHHGDAVERFLLDTADALPADSVLIGTGDHLLFGFLALQTTGAGAGHIVYVDARMLLYPWYASRTSAALGMPLAGIDHDGRQVSMPALIGGLLAGGRRVFLSEVVSPTIPRHFALVPRGNALEVLPHGASPPSLDDVVRENVALAARMRLPSDPPDRVGPWGRLVYRTYARPWRELAAALAAAGRDADAARMLAIAEKLDPAGVP